MSASRKLRTAHFLMFIGVAPMAFAAVFTAAAFCYTHAHLGQAGASDAFLLITMLLFGYATTLILGGTGVVWSWFLTKQGIDKLWTATVVLRTIVMTALLLPLLWYVILLFR
jgi:hypothetical protein